MYRKKHIIAFLIATFLLLTVAVYGSDKPLWERLEDLQYSSYAPGLRFLTKKYGNIFEMDEYGQITSTLPEYWGMAFEAEFNENTFMYEDNFLVQYRREEIEDCLQEILEPVVGECKIYVEGKRTSLSKDVPLEDILTHKNHIVKLNVCIPLTDEYQFYGIEVIEELSNQGYIFSTIEVLFFNTEQYNKVERNWVVPRLRGAGMMKDDSNYSFEHRLAVWFNSNTEEYVMNWR